MRIARVLCLAWIVSLTSLCVPVMAGQKRAAVAKPQPNLVKVVMYQWALSTGGTKVDFQNRRLDGFTRGVEISEEEWDAIRQELKPDYPVFQIRARLTNEHTRVLKELIEGSGLRDFRPQASDIRERQPLVDECPPTLVIMWTDKRRVFQLPLHDTVRSDISAERRQAYRRMGDLCEGLVKLSDQYSVRPYFAAVPVHGKEYKAFEEERNRLTNTTDVLRASQEDDIREAVFRYQFKHNNSKQQQKAEVYFLSIEKENTKTDPSDSFLKRFANHKPPVKKRSDSKYNNVREGVRDRTTDKQGLIFTVGSIKWKSETEAEVEGGYFEDGRAASRNVYTLIKKNGRWVVTKDKLVLIARAYSELVSTS